MLSYHIAPEKLASARLKSLTEIPTTLDELSFRRSNDAPLTLVDKAPDLRDPKLVADRLDMEARNGVVHLVDRVAFPFALDKDAFVEAIDSLPTPEPDDADDPAGDDDFDSNINKPFSPTPKTETNDNSRSCFPAAAVIHMPDGSDRPLHALRAGDAIRATTAAADPVHSPVYFFSHKIESGRFEFVRVESDRGHVLTLSERHYVYSGGRRVVAGALREGDALETLDGPAAVVAVGRVVAEGLIAPHTMHGDLIVNRVRTSSYTAAVHPYVAHFALAPVRALVAAGFGKEPLGSLFYNGSGSWADWAPQGPDVA